MSLIVNTLRETWRSELKALPVNPPEIERYSNFLDDVVDDDAGGGAYCDSAGDGDGIITGDQYHMLHFLFWKMLLLVCSTSSTASGFGARLVSTSSQAMAISSC